MFASKVSYIDSFPQPFEMYKTTMAFVRPNLFQDHDPFKRERKYNHLVQRPHLHEVDFKVNNFPCPFGLKTLPKRGGF